MKTLIFFLSLILILNTSARAQSGHLPIAHAHSSDCSGTGGVCYGYAMGKSAGAGVSPGIYSGCNPATMIPPSPATCSDNGTWAVWAVDANYWTYTADASLSVSGPIIIKFSGHVSFVSMTSGIDSIAVSHIRSAGLSPVYTDKIYKQASNYKLTIPGGGTYYSEGYYKLSSFDVKAQNLFYDGSNTTVNQGSITIAGATGTSPVTAYSKVWNVEYTASATDNQTYPTGYRQIFNTTTGWTRGGGQRGTTLEIPIEVSATLYTYQANFYQAAGVTFTPSGGGGGITVDGQTRYSSYTKYARLTTPAEQVNATAVNTTASRVEYLFANWTNSGNSNVDYTSSISFYPSAVVTYTANFTAKPLQAENCYAGGVVGNPVQITWTQHPNTNVTYKIYRRVKPLGGSTGSETLIASLTNSATSYTDYDYIVTSTYSNDLLSYDVRSYLSGVYSDPNFVQVFGRMNARQVEDGGVVFKHGELPTEYTISSYPNPFNPSTTISYQLVEEANVTLEIYDMMGRKISSLVQEPKQAGYHTAKWEGKDNTGKQVATGAYLYRFSAVPASGKQPFTKSGKLLLTK